MCVFPKRLKILIFLKELERFPHCELFAGIDIESVQSVHRKNRCYDKILYKRTIKGLLNYGILKVTKLITSPESGKKLRMGQYFLVLNFILHN